MAKRIVPSKQGKVKCNQCNAERAKSSLKKYGNVLLCTRCYNKTVSQK